MTSAEREELTRLHRENRVLQEEREILKKAAACFATEGTTRLAAIGSSRRSRHGMRSLSCVGCSACPGPAPTPGATAPTARRASADGALMETIRQIHAELAQEHRVRCGRKRVARLMRRGGLVGCHRRRTVKTTRREATAPPAPDLVGRRFVADVPDLLWGADITDLPTGQGFVYLAVVLDVRTRKIVGWACRAICDVGRVVSDR